MERFVGNYYIPKIRLGILLDHLINLDKIYPHTPFTKEQFRIALNLGMKSSGIQDKIRDMIYFGLIKLEKHEVYSISELGKNILIASDTERPNEIKKAIKSVPLWHELLDALDKPNSEPFIQTLQKIIGIHDNSKIEKLEKIKWAFNEDFKCVSKRPPYSILSKNIGKVRPAYLKLNSSIPNNKIKKIEPTASLMIHYRDYNIPVIDELSYKMAEEILKKIRLDLEKNDSKYEN
jgi:hypothetical protein